MVDSRGLLAAALLGAAVAVSAQSSGSGAESDVEMSPISGDPDSPRRHFRLRDPAKLGGAEAERIYRIALGALREGYAASGVAPATGFLGWTRYNRVPYLSATHGNHYVNNYANGVAKAYGSFEKAGRMPVGSIVAKDSFSVTETGGILLGPLFLMEKMSAGFNNATGDWRYSVVYPDGTFGGETGGRGAERVDYCIACHLAVEAQDHLYFIPAPVRADLE